MINESIMCGTPVVAFDIGVADELIVNGETGYKAKLYDCDDFSAGIYEILDADLSKEQLMSDKCRALAMRTCSPEVQARAFMSLCEEVMSTNTGNLQ